MGLYTLLKPCLKGENITKKDLKFKYIRPVNRCGYIRAIHISYCIFNF